MNRIFLCGDTHGDIDLAKLNSKNFPPKGKENDYVIILGDVGMVWDGGPQDRYLQKWYNNKPWTTLFIDGNHSNHDLLNSYPVEMWHGGKVHVICRDEIGNPKVIHLMRGQIFTIEGKTFFTMGGAVSQDKYSRQEGVSWWASEVPSVDEMREGIDNLAAVGDKVDYILTHCAPASVQMELAYWYRTDEVTRYLELIRQTVDFGHWFCAHYHVDRRIGARHTVVYDEIIEL